MDISKELTDLKEKETELENTISKSKFELAMVKAKIKKLTVVFENAKAILNPVEGTKP